MAIELPETMNVIAIPEPGGPDALTPEARPVPGPAPGEVLVRVSHAGVNRPDCLQRAGAYPPPKGASDLPGLEISGEIVALGEGVDRAELGKKICALVNGGGYAQYCIARPEHCLPVPDNLPLAQAAAIPETLFTVWHNVFQRGLARDGETILIHGGTSGIGTMATMLAKLFDMTVITTSGSDEKCAASRQVGADLALNYKTQDFVEQARAFTDGRGVELVLDMVAGDYTQRNLDALGEDGRLVVIAVLGGAKSQINMAKMMVRRQSITGSTLRPRSNVFKGMLADELFQVVWPLVEDGQLRPVMDQTFAMADAARAHERMEAGEHIGKIVLDMTGSGA